MPEVLQSTIFSFDKNPKQRQFTSAVLGACNNTNAYRYFFYGGAVRGGKTSVCIVTLHLLAVRYPGSRWHIIRDSFPNLEATTIPSFQKFFPEDVDSIRDYKRAKDNYHVTYNNGSQIFFKSESLNHDPLLAWMDGLETNGVFLEQIDGLNIKTWDKSIERAGSWYIDPMPPPIILSTFNPTQNWIRDKVHEKYKRGLLETPYYYIQALPTDNPFVTSEQWEGWRNMDSITYKQKIEGDWDAFNAVNAFAHAFNSNKHTVDNQISPDDEIPLYLSFDFNHSPVTCTMWQHYDDKIYCLREFSSTVGLKDLCDKLAGAIGWLDDELSWDVFVTGDKSGWNRSELLEGNRTAYDIIKQALNLTQYQMHTPKSNPNLLKSRELVNGILEHYPEFVISATECPNLVFDLKFVEADEKHQIIKDRNKTEGKADFLDTLRYYLNTYHENFIRL